MKEVIKLSKMQLVDLKHICKKGWGGYSKSCNELDEMVKNGLLTKSDGPFSDVVYRPTDYGYGYINSCCTMTKENEICSRAKYSTPSATADARQASESTLNKLAIVESCIIDLVRMKSLMYNHDLINPFLELYPNNIDPFDLLDDIKRFIDDFSILHTVLGKEVVHA